MGEKGSSLKAEIFAVGKWNGKAFSAEDLQSIVDNFSSFKDLLKVPLKFGHNDEQPVTDGEPALGWVEKVWVEGTKLMAEFSDVPSVVMNAIKKKLYRKVSIELDIDVNHKGKSYDYVLSGVALLGADIPAVSTLADLDSFMARRAAFSSGRRAAFSAIAGLNQSGDDNMEQLEKLTKQVADLTAANATLTAQISQLTLSKADADAKLAAFQKAETERTAEAHKALMSAKRTEAVKLFDDAIKAGTCTPAQKASFCKVLRLDDDAALAALSLDDVKALVPATKQNFSQHGHGQGHDGGDDEASKDAGALVVEKANALLAKGEAKTFNAAMQMVFTADPALARRYLNSNDEGN